MNIEKVDTTSTTDVAANQLLDLLTQKDAIISPRVASKIAEKLDNMNLTNTRLIQLLGISEDIEKKFLEGDRFGTVFALIKAGISEEEYEEFLKINPNNWYDAETRNILNETILSRGHKGRPMMLRTNPEEALEIHLSTRKGIKALQGE